jgi:adenine-specific DNA glycosylase
MVLCKGQASPESYPRAKQKKAAPVRKKTIVVFEDGQGRYHLMRRETRFLHGLYGFMEYEEGALAVQFGGKTHTLHKGMLLGAVTQVYSHFTLEAKLYRVRLKALPEGGTHATLKKMASLPLSRADHKIVRLLEE